MGDRVDGDVGEDAGEGPQQQQQQQMLEQQLLFYLQALPQCLRALVAGQRRWNVGLGGRAEPMPYLWAQLLRASKLRPVAAQFGAAPTEAGAESQLHAVMDTAVRNLVVAKKVHKDDEEEALLYVGDYFTGDAYGVWHAALVVQRQWLSGSGIRQDSLLTRALVFMLEKYVNPRGKWDIEEVLDKAAWDADGVMASQALFTKIFQESSVIAQRTANNLPLEVHEELTFLAQFRIIQRSWPAWAQELARSSPQLFVSLPALWAVLQQHEPRPALASTAPAAPVPSLPALGGATDDRAILLAACAEL